MLDTHNHEGKSSAHYPMNIVGKGLGALVLGLLVVGCGDIRRGARTIYHDDESFVRLVPDLTVNKADPYTLHAHPLQFSADAVAALLRGVEVQERSGLLRAAILGKPGREKAFKDQKLSLLAPLIQDALAKALPAEQVVFSLSEITSLQVQEITSGAVFAHGRQLHLVLANYRYRIDLSQGGPRYDSNWPELQITPQDYELFFVREEFATRPTIGTFARWFRAERPELLIDYVGFLAAEGLHQPTTASATGDRSPAGGPSEPSVTATSLEKGTSPPASQGQAPSDRQKQLQQVLNETLKEIKVLKEELAKAKQALAAKDAEIKQRKAKRKPAAVPKKPVP